MEHHGHLRRGQVLGCGEETPAEDLEGQVAGAEREADQIQQLPGAQVVQAFVHARRVHVQQLQRGGQVHPDQLTERETPAGGRQGEGVPRRGRGEAGEPVGQPGGVHQRVVRQRRQAGQFRVGVAQQRAQVVVLPEEGVEAPAHRRGGAVRQFGVPAAQPAAQPLLAFQDPHPDTALGQRAGGRQPGDAPADHRHPRGAPGRRSHRRGRRDRLRGRVVYVRVHQRPPGRAPTKVWVIPYCQPGSGAPATDSSPAARIRASRARAPSNSTTLRHR